MGKIPVPVVGDVLKEYTKAIWKDPGPRQLFKQMKDYVDKMVPELISDQHITDLREGVEGVNNALKAYDDTDIPEEKAKYLTSIETAIDIALEPKYFDSRAPEKALPVFCRPRHGQADGAARTVSSQQRLLLHRPEEIRLRQAPGREIEKIQRCRGEIHRRRSDDQGKRHEVAARQITRR
jgi:hypothetical protein